MYSVVETSLIKIALPGQNMIRILFALSIAVAAPAHAENYSISADEFDWHTYRADMAGFTEDAEGQDVRELGVNEQLHIRYWIDSDLYSYASELEENRVAFEVCATVANLNSGDTNTVRINHPNPVFNVGHTLESNQYQTLCSRQGQFDGLLQNGTFRSAGVKVVSGSQGPVEVRNVSFRAMTQNSTELTTETSPSWDLDLFRSARNTDPDEPTFAENEQARAVLEIGDVVYVGGEFQNIKNGGTVASPAIKYIAAFDRDTGNPIPGFDIELNGSVSTLASSPDNDTLYIGGAFTTANGQNRKFFAAYDIEDNGATLTGLRLKRDGINSSPNRVIQEIAATDDTLYIGGNFTKVGGDEDHAYVAAFNSTSGEIIDSFTPKPNKRVIALVAGGNEGLWMGGDFERVNGTAREGLALVDYNTGELDTSSPDVNSVNYPVIDLAATSDQLFVGGGGQSGNARFTGNIAAAFDRTTLENQWALQGDGNVQAVDVNEGRYVYFGGHYQRFRFIRNDSTGSDGKFIVDGDTVERLSRHDKETGEIDFTWLPYVNGIRSVNDIHVSTDGLFVVGDFTQAGGDTTTANDSRRKDHRGFVIFTGATN